MSEKDKFMLYANKRLEEKRRKKDKEYAAYLKIAAIGRKRKWNVRCGGYRW